MGIKVASMKEETYIAVVGQHPKPPPEKLARI